MNDVIYFCRPSNAARRRLTLETPSFYSRTTATAAGRDYYVPESPNAREDRYWGPGQVLPTNFRSESDVVPAQQSSQGEGDEDVKSLIQGLQSSVETNFEDIKKKLGDLEDRVARVEEKQLQIQNSPISSDYNSSSCSLSDTRKRRSPPDLQVRVYLLCILVLIKNTFLYTVYTSSFLFSLFTLSFPLSQFPLN